MNTTVQGTCRRKQKQTYTVGSLTDQTSWRMGVLVEPGLRRKLFFGFSLLFPGNLSKIFFSELQTK